MHTDSSHKLISLSMSLVLPTQFMQTIRFLINGFVSFNVFILQGTTGSGIPEESCSVRVVHIRCQMQRRHMTCGWLHIGQSHGHADEQNRK